jgi:shikimate kinase
LALQPAEGSPVRAVFLVGFMGAGKSSVGRALGEALNCAFEDLDDRIERSEGRSIAEIFRASGEAEFRRLEQRALRQILQELAGEIKIVGLGGGAFVQAENAALLEAPGVLTVFLDAPVDELWRRCVQQAERQGLNRPLLQSIEQFRMLCENRRTGYLKASLRIETGSRTVTAIAKEIVEVIRLNRSQLK